jgi:hypothetical protein
VGGVVPETDTAAVAAAVEHLRERLARPDFEDPFLAAVADWWEAALAREAAYVLEWTEIAGTVDMPEPGDEFYAAATLARVYLEGRT